MEQEKKGCIYIIQNCCNNKVYIGKTIQPLSKRWNQHKNASKTSDCLLFLSMRKYGVDNFQIKILEDNILKSKLNEREEYWISKYNSNNPDYGYNMTIGGDGGNTSEEGQHIVQIDLNKDVIIREFISYNAAAKFLGNIKYASNIRAACIGKQKQAYGFRWSLADNIIFKDIKNNKKKSVVQIDKNTDEIIQIFNCVADAAEFLSGERENTYSTSIANCCRGCQHTAYGYKWKYEDNKKTPSCKKVYQLNEDKQIINVYDSITEASIAIHGNKNVSYLSQALSNPELKAYGFYWRKEEDYE